MKFVYLALVAMLAMGVMAGCATWDETKISMPYTMEVERTDQMVAGNQGYIKGTPPPPEDMTGRKRSYLAINVDLPRSSKEAGIPDTKMVNVSKGKPSIAAGRPKQVEAEQVK